MKRAVIPVIALALLPDVRADNVECALSYSEYPSRDDCIVHDGEDFDLVIKDTTKQTYPWLVRGGSNLYDGACNIIGADSFKTQCTAKPNEVLNVELSTGDTTCGSGSPTSIALTVDGDCQTIEVDGKSFAYKATPVPPDPVCFNKYEEFESSAACAAGTALASDSDKLTLPNLVGAPNQANLKNNACFKDGANSYKTLCSFGPYGPDKLVKYEEHQGSAECTASGATLKSVDLRATATCESAQKPDGSGTFYYKASPAKCFNFFVEYPSEMDCKNNERPNEGADAVYPFLIGRANSMESYDKKCNVYGGKSYRTTCGEEGNGAQEAGAPDATLVMESYSVADCNIAGKKAKTQALTVDGTCHNFLKNGETIWYKAVQTTDNSQYRPGENPPLGDSATCTENKIVNDGANDGKRCVQWEGAPLICSSMGFSAEGYDTGLYFKKQRLAKDNAPDSNRCKVNCIDQGDIFCVDKNDLQSNPVCCPKECNDPDNGGANMCSNTLKAVGSHVCSDQFSRARDEFKYLVCPRETMDEKCAGPKIVKFDVEKDNNKVLKYSVPFYPPDTPENPTAFPVYGFDKQGLCNYVFIMPDNAALGSSFEIKFKGDVNMNKNTQAYYASYRSGDEDVLPGLGEMLTQYDGEWTYVVPPDASDSVKANPEGNGYIQQSKVFENPESLQFRELKDLIELSGGSPAPIKHTLSDVPKNNVTIAFLSIMTAYQQSDAVGGDIYKKQYKRQGGAFEFEVHTSFRKKNAIAEIPTDAEVEAYERAQEEKRSEALILILLVLAGVVALVVLIFIYQAICGKHSEYEYQKRAMVYRKEDANIRNTIKRRQSTMAGAKPGGSAQRLSEINARYESVPQSENAQQSNNQKASYSKAPENVVGEVAADLEMDKPEVHNQEAAIQQSLGNKSSGRGGQAQPLVGQGSVEQQAPLQQHQEVAYQQQEVAYQQPEVAIQQQSEGNMPRKPAIVLKDEVKPDAVPEVVVGQKEVAQQDAKLVDVQKEEVQIEIPQPEEAQQEKRQVAPVEVPQAASEAGPSAVSISDMDMEEGMEGDRNEQTVSRNIGR